MSGKSEGKERNRAAQSEQHGYQEPKDIKATSPVREPVAEEANRPSAKRRVLDKIRDLERRRRDQGKE